MLNDFGPKFTVVDPTGEEPLTGMVVSVDEVCDAPFKFTTHVLTLCYRTRRVLCHVWTRFGMG